MLVKLILAKPFERGHSIYAHQIHKACMITADAWNGEKRLFDELFANYSSEVRPRLNSRQSVAVSLELELRQIKQLVGYLMLSLCRICHIFRACCCSIITLLLCSVHYYSLFYTRLSRLIFTAYDCQKT